MVFFALAKGKNFGIGSAFCKTHIDPKSGVLVGAVHCLQQLITDFAVVNVGGYSVVLVVVFYTCIVGAIGVAQLGVAGDVASAAAKAISWFWRINSFLTPLSQCIFIAVAQRTWPL